MRNAGRVHASLASPGTGKARRSRSILKRHPPLKRPPLKRLSFRGGPQGRARNPGTRTKGSGYGDPAFLDPFAFLGSGLTAEFILGAAESRTRGRGPAMTSVTGSIPATP